jgi:hypothetical protein
MDGKSLRDYITAIVMTRVLFTDEEFTNAPRPLREKLFMVSADLAAWDGPGLDIRLKAIMYHMGVLDDAEILNFCNQIIEIDQNVKEAVAEFEKEMDATKHIRKAAAKIMAEGGIHIEI